jgi:hypothetical protein
MDRRIDRHRPKNPIGRSFHLFAVAVVPAGLSLFSKCIVVLNLLFF